MPAVAIFAEYILWPRLQKTGPSVAASNDGGMALRDALTITDGPVRAAVLRTPGPIAADRLVIENREPLAPAAGEVLVRVQACGVCRTDLHVVEGDLEPRHAAIVPGHQIVGTVAKVGAGVRVEAGTRVGISWLGGVDGTCRFCREGRENLCDAPVFTGYDIDGGYATWAVARADFVYPLHESLDDLQAAPLLCAGIIGYRALRVAGVEPGEHVGLYGFGSSAHLALPLLRAWGCRVSVATRGERQRAFAERLGADWVGDALDRPPIPLDRAVTFAPAGDVVVAALAALRKGGVVAINAIHLDRMPAFDYDTLLWGEREIRSVTNMTRKDATDFLSLAANLRLKPETTVFALDEVNGALRSLKSGEIVGSAVIAMM